MSRLISLWILLSCVLSTGVAQAVIPRQALDRQRAMAPERIEIEVVEARQESLPEANRVTGVYKAKVRSVVISKTGLRLGELITVRYSIRRAERSSSVRQKTGGRVPVRALSKGWSGCAFLSGSREKGFGPFAQHASFTTNNCPSKQQLVPTGPALDNE